MFLCKGVACVSLLPSTLTAPALLLIAGRSPGSLGNASPSTSLLYRQRPLSFSTKPGSRHRSLTQPPYELGQANALTQGEYGNRGGKDRNEVQEYRSPSRADAPDAKAPGHEGCH